MTKRPWLWIGRYVGGAYLWMAIAALSGAIAPEVAWFLFMGLLIVTFPASLGVYYLGAVEQNHTGGTVLLVLLPLANAALILGSVGTYGLWKRFTRARLREPSN